MAHMTRPRLIVLARALHGAAALLFSAAAQALRSTWAAMRRGTLVLSNHASSVKRRSSCWRRRSIPRRPRRLMEAALPQPAAAPLSGEIRAAAQRHALPESLLAAVIAVESGFNLSGGVAQGRQGPDAADARDRAALRREGRIRGAAEHRRRRGLMRWLLTQFDNDLQLALAAYNAGEGAVAPPAGACRPHPETQDYVAKVMARLASR